MDHHPLDSWMGAIMCVIIALGIPALIAMLIAYYFDLQFNRFPVLFGGVEVIWLMAVHAFLSGSESVSITTGDDDDS